MTSEPLCPSNVRNVALETSAELEARFIDAVKMGIADFKAGRLVAHAVVIEALRKFRAPR